MEKLYIKLLTVFLFIQVSEIEAHPGIGMVYDGNNTLYYTDLEHIWKYDLTNDQASVLIPNVHSHELCSDSLGNLYGEHYYYVEEQQKFKNYIWRYSKERGFSIVRKEKDGENIDFSFIRDQHFNAIQFRKIGEFTEVRKVFNDSSQYITKQVFKDLRWKSLNNHNELFLIDYHSLYKIDSNNQVQLLAEDLSATKFPFSFNDEKHNVYGVWSDDDQNTYVAIYGGRQIKRIDDHHNVSTIYKSSFFWSPLNGLFDKEGRLWIMEGSLWGDTRIRLLKQNQTFKVGNLMMWTLFAFILVAKIRALRRAQI